MNTKEKIEKRFEKQFGTLSAAIEKYGFVGTKERLIDFTIKEVDRSWVERFDHVYSEEDIDHLKTFTLEDFKNPVKGSGNGDIYYSKSNKGREVLFYYDNGFKEARIMFNGSGRWLASMKFKKQTPEECLKDLLNVIKYK